MSGLAPRYLVIDGFLGEEAADTLLAQMLAGAGNFTPSLVWRGDRFAENHDVRSSLRLPGRVGVDLEGFTAAMVARADELREAIGMPPFAIFHAERSVVAHGDGDYYRPHIDTLTQPGGGAPDSVRMMSCVYYLNAQPPGFTGGELALHRLGGPAASEPAAVIEPRHDRLAVFPSFVPHEVLPIACPSGRFEDSRFSVNCWLHRARAQPSAE